MGRIFLCWIAVLGLQGAAPAAFANAECASTPAAAIAAAGAEPTLLPAASEKGYRVTGVRWDPVLRQSWTTIVRCDHPEWPAFSLREGEMNRTFRGPAAHAGEERSPAVPVVRAGDIVQLWRHEDLLRIEVAGVAEESGSVGKTVRVRLRQRDAEGQSTEEQFTGIVRGPSDVEIQP